MLIIAILFCFFIWWFLADAEGWVRCKEPPFCPVIFFVRFICGFVVIAGLIKLIIGAFS